MAFVQVKNTREHIFKPRITMNNLIYLRQTEVEGIQNFKFATLHVDKEKGILGIKFTNHKLDDVFRVTRNGKNSFINIRSALRELDKKLTSKFFIKNIKKEKGMYIIDLSEAK